VNPDIAAFVNSCGGLGIDVREPEDPENSITRALAHEGPATVVQRRMRD